MARYKPYNYSQGKFLSVFFDKQILPGTFEFTLNYLIDEGIDLSIFEGRYNNDETGAPAYDPAILLQKEQEKQYVETLKKKARKIHDWLKENAEGP